jgi:hypothetical protein
MRARGAAALAALASLPGCARAHGFGERYDLPAPLGYFVTGAAAAVALTFIVAVVSVRRERGREAPYADAPLPSASAPPALALRGVALAAFLLVIAAGLWGDPHPAKNIAPTVVWILGWVGLSLFCAVIGNAWPLIDPWASLHCLLPRKPAPRPWPAHWGARPAVALFLVFAWLEVVDPLSSSPRHLAALLLAWTVVNVAGMAVFGREAWQRHADPLAVYFATLGRFAPLGAEDGRLVLRPWARRLVNTAPAAPAAFVIAMLATVLFDGLLGTQWWRRVDTAFTAWAPGWNDRDNVVLGTLGLAATFAQFFAAYRAACAATTLLVRDAGTSRIAERFAPTLVPIAVAYLLAHNLSYLLVQGQGVIPLMSDPFGRGWNLFGTAGYTPAIGIVDARFGWYVATIAIVGGHVISVWLAHRVALRAWPQHRRAVLGSVPLTLLMIALTAVSLAIVADPLTRFRSPDPGYTLAPTCGSARSSPSSSCASTLPTSTGPSSPFPALRAAARRSSSTSPRARPPTACPAKSRSRNRSPGSREAVRIAT